MLTRAYRSSGAVICVWLAVGLSTSAQAAPWVLYADVASDSLCDVVNAANLELVVLEATGELVGITRTDVIFLDTFVDEDGFVFFQGLPAGFIEFAEDGDGFRTLWWLTLLGDVADVNEFTGEPTLTGLLPADFVDVPCDACPFWDEPAECLDSDLDGVEDLFDLCPFTPLDEIADIDGCSCSQLDSDLDGIDDCFDLCPFTPLDELPDIFGCSCSQLDGDQDGVDDCIDFCPDTLFGLSVGADGCACDVVDSDLDGVSECFDLCLNTPLDEWADADGCSCSQLDDDQDGVDNCFDLCSGTPLWTAVDFDGCPISGPGSGGTVINLCGAVGAIIMPIMLCTLGMLRFRPRGVLR